MSRQDPGRTLAETRRSWWAGWIWAAPVAAVGVAGWLGVRALARGGESVTLAFDSAHGMTPGDTKVVLRGVKVGEVSRVELVDHARSVEVVLKLDSSVDDYLRSGTKFWLEGANVSLSNPASLKAIVAGPTVEMDPGPGPKTKHFVGLAQSPADSPIGPRVPYLVRFFGAVGGLKAGSPVRLRGFRVGEVTGVQLAYDASISKLETPVTIALEPARLHIHGVAPTPNGDWRPATDAMLRTLIGQGLRANLTQSPPLVGADEVDLDFAPGAKPATLAAEGGMETIPSGGGSGLRSIADKADEVMNRANLAMAKVDDVMTKADQIPLGQIGGNVRAITGRVRSLVSSPKVTDAIDHVDSTTAQLDQTVHRVSPNVEAVVAKLRQTADRADAAIAAADRVIGGSPESQDNDLPSALHELTDAARALRALANELRRHPEAIIKGTGHDK